MEVLRPVPKQPLGISLTKGTVPLKDTTTPSTPAGLLLFPGQEGSPLLLQVKKPTSWYKPQCGSSRHKPLAGFYTVYSPTAGQKSFLEKKEQSWELEQIKTNYKNSQQKTLSPRFTRCTQREREERRRSLNASVLQMLEHFFLGSGSFSLFLWVYLEFRFLTGCTLIQKIFRKALYILQPCFIFYMSSFE